MMNVAKRKKHVEGIIETPSVFDQQVDHNSGTHVGNTSLTGNINTCAKPPMKPRRKCKADSEEAKVEEEEIQEEKTQGGKPESEGQGKKV